MRSGSGQGAQPTAKPVTCPGESSADIALTDPDSLRDLSVVVTIEMQIQHLSQLAWELVDRVSQTSTSHDAPDLFLGTGRSVLGIHLGQEDAPATNVIGRRAERDALAVLQYVASEDSPRNWRSAFQIASNMS